VDAPTLVRLEGMGWYLGEEYDCPFPFDVPRFPELSRYGWDRPPEPPGRFLRRLVLSSAAGAQGWRLAELIVAGTSSATPPRGRALRVGWGPPGRSPATPQPHPVRCLRSGGLVTRRLREHLIRGVRGRPPSPPATGAGPSCIAASRGVTSLRSLRPYGRRSSGRVVVVGLRCAASRRALGGWAWCGCRPERQVETAKRRRLAFPLPGALCPTGGGGCAADLLGPSASRSRPDPTVRACKRWTRATRCAHALERQWPSSARGSRTPRTFIAQTSHALSLAGGRQPVEADGAPRGCIVEEPVARRSPRVRLGSSRARPRLRVSRRARRG
jgi:hypothetical protein